jgi:tetratricopeptide (TPR) repeat protein
MDIHHLIQSRYHDIDGHDEFDRVLDDITDRKELAEIYFKLGFTYLRTYGDIDESDHFYNKALEIFEEEGLREKYILTLRDIYVNDELRGDYDNALAGFESCFEMSKEIGYEHGICISYGGIVLLHIHLKDFANTKVAELCNECKHLAEKLDSDLLRESAVLGEAVQFIFESRLKYQMKGQELLEGLMDTTFRPIKVSATEFLIISYLEEMIRTNNKELLYLSKQLIDDVKPWMKSNLVQKLRITILESKLHMIDGNLAKTKDLLEGLLEEVSGQGMKKMFVRFSDEIKSELEGLNDEYSKWKKLIATNASFKEIMDNSAMRQYILKAKNAIINKDA